MTFSRTQVRKLSARSFLAPLALAAVAGLATAGAPAMAQKKDKKEQAASKASYSKEFVAAYKPFEAGTAEGTTPDYAALKAQVPALTSAATTPDDKAAAGRMIFTIGHKSKDYPLALQGIEMALASGRLDAATQGQFAYVGGQLAYNMQDYGKARTLVDTAIKVGYTDNNPQLFLSDIYFAEKNYPAGLKVLEDAVAASKAAGQVADESVYKRGLSSAYNAKLVPETRKWALLYADAYPSQNSWGDAIAIAINTEKYPVPEMLDLLRLARATGTMRTREMYLEYADAADARKLPSEVVTLLDEGKAAKLIDENNQMVKDARSVANARIAADTKELPALQRDANAAGAKLVTVMAAADTLLSYGKNAEAEALYAKAAAMPGANVPLVLTRQGIAQVNQGKFAEAQATLAKVQGNRTALAQLWSLYAKQKAEGRTIAPAAAPTAAPAAAPAA